MTSRLKKFVTGLIYGKPAIFSPASANSSSTEMLLELQVQQSRLLRLGPKALGQWGCHLYSQNFEDGIIAEIVSRIGDGSRTFVEIGVENGLECNTRFLLQQGWRGLWIEGSAKHVEAARARFAAEIANGQLQIVQQWISPQNVQQIISNAGFADNLDFLSVDIDMQTHNVWRAIETLPRFACIEYNGNIPPSVDFEVPNDAGHDWQGNAFYGASLKALEKIGREKSMSLVGCDTHGINAFFVRDGLTADYFAAPFTAEHQFEPMRLSLVKRQGHRRPS